MRGRVAVGEGVSEEVVLARVRRMCDPVTAQGRGVPGSRRSRCKGTGVGTAAVPRARQGADGSHHDWTPGSEGREEEWRERVESQVARALAAVERRSD